MTRRLALRLYDRLTGASVSDQAEYATELSPRAKFYADPELEVVRIMRANQNRVAGVKVKRLIEDQPTSFVAAMPFDDSEYCP